MRMLLDSFASDRGGNFALMTAVVTVPLVLGVGLALDASTIARTQSALQQAIDSAVLAVASEGKDISDARATEVARQFLASNSDLTLANIQFKRDGTKVTLDATSKARMAFGGLLGYEAWPVAAIASADIAYLSYEVGLVLDTTGSMAGGKLVAMKDAVTGLIDTMSAQVSDKNKLKFGLVPFSTFVNVGPGFAPKFDKTGKQIDGTGADWLDLAGASSIAQHEFPQDLSRFQVYNNINQSWPGCIETRPVVGGVDYGTTDDLADASKPDTLFVPAFAIDEEDKGYYNSYFSSKAKTSDKSVKGIAMKMKKYGVPVDGKGKAVKYGKKSLDNPEILTDWTKMTISGGGSGYMGYQKGPGFACVAQPITPLTNDYALLKKQVDALVANGHTNIMEGVAWGMRVLSPGEPFAQGQDSTKTGVQKMMIVLTDGSNTFGNTSTALGSTYNSFGYLADGRIGISSGGSAAATAKMNERTLAACTSAKAAGMEVYTIRLEEPNVATGTMLKECASSPDNYFDVPSRSQLDEVFSKIRDKIVRIRMAS